MLDTRGTMLSNVKKMGSNSLPPSSMRFEGEASPNTTKMVYQRKNDLMEPEDDNDNENY